MSTIPSEKPELKYPGHELSFLYIEPKFMYPKPGAEGAIRSIATYLDRLFPHLEDITTYAKEMFDAGPLGLFGRVLTHPQWQTITLVSKIT
jgi:hypothetical protein